MMESKGSLTYRGIRRLLGELGLTAVWEQLSAYYLWRRFSLFMDQRLFRVVFYMELCKNILSTN